MARPREWSELSVGAFAEVRGGTGFPLYLQGQTSGELPFYKVSDMNAAGNETWMRQANNYVTLAELSKLGGRAFAPRTIVFPKVGATIYTNKKRILATPGVVDNNVMGVTVVDPTVLPEFVFFWFQGIELAHLSSPGALPSITSARVKSQKVLLPPFAEQRQIARLLLAVLRTIERLERLIELTAELKKALLHQLFTQGVAGEPLQQTDIGLMPQSWKPTPLGTCCDIVSGSMSYSEFDRAPNYAGVDAIKCMAVKVSDMNLPGNEEAFVTANALKDLPAETAKKKLVTPGAVVFPKRGAAIATNKKRQTTTWTALDPNLIAVRGGREVEPRFLFYWSQTFDLRRITDPGPTPQLNKKDLMPVKMPLPPTIGEQRIVSHALDCASAKEGIHRNAHSTANSLFRTLLHELMTAQVRVQDLDLSALEEAAVESIGGL